MDDHIPPQILARLPERPEWLPTQLLSGEEMILTVQIWAGEIQDRMTVEQDQVQLRAAIKGCVLAGTLPTLQVIRAADRYAEVDMALRELLAEGLDDIDAPDLQRTSLRAYLQSALLRAPTTNPHGFRDSPYHRDLGICVLMAMSLWTSKTTTVAAY